jgi:hypothetical protein
MTDKQYGVMKGFTGGEHIIAGNDILGIPYNKIMKIISRQVFRQR